MSVKHIHTRIHLLVGLGLFLLDVVNWLVMFPYQVYERLLRIHKELWWVWNSYHFFFPNTVNGAGLGPVGRLTQCRGQDEQRPVVYGSHA